MTKTGKPSWHISENEVTPEEIHKRRREFIKQGSLWIGAAGFTPLWWGREAEAAVVLTYPAKKNATYKVEESDRPITKEDIATSYNNFYEFSLEKDGVKPLAEKWKRPSPWKVEVTGLTDEKKTYDFEDLVRLAGDEEERIYRFRCVEAWSTVIPWTGVPLEKVISKLKPKASAKYVVFTSYANDKEFPNIKKMPYYPWPYTEGLRMDEAMHPLAFLATGMYGKALPNQNGAPLRLVVPWKYGFKSIKSIVKIEFSDKEPKTLWNQLAPEEYGFYANVNPEVDHPRWSQATERVLNGKFFPTRIKTLKFNGYEKEVAGLYKGMDLKKTF